jgi:hypothetical protein
MGKPISFVDVVGRAGLNACLALFGSACISAGSVDLGFLFFIFFALAASGRQLRERAAPALVKKQSVGWRASFHAAGT